MSKKTESNSYTITFSIIMVVVVGLLLSFTALSLKDRIKTNERNEKRMNILAAMGVASTMDNSEELYKKHIEKAIALNSKGEVLPDVDAFSIDMVKEVKKPVEEQRLPLYIGENDGQTYSIIPLNGNGLWDIIWGYIALKKDLTVQGVVFDHKGETPGLGAEIKEGYFQARFDGEHILDKQNNFMGITVSKSNGDPTNNDKEDNEVDAIAGATITSNGVTNMIKSRLSLYTDYLEKEENKN